MLAAAVLVPATVALVWAGGVAWTIAVAAATALALWEWARLTGGGAIAVAGYLTIAAASGALIFAWAGAWPGLIAVLICATAAGGFDTARRGAVPGLRLAAGAAYIGLAAIGLVWLRTAPSVGLAGLLWLLAAVWAADAGAYLSGRAIGGPRLAPRLSPNKTWAGFGGAMVGAGLVGLAFGWFWPGAPPPAALGVAGLVLGIVGQGGDLLESAAKRHYGVKDSSALIPGHGGVLDRVDALMAVTILFSIFYLAGGAGLTWS